MFKFQISSAPPLEERRRRRQDDRPAEEAVQEPEEAQPEARLQHTGQAHCNST